MPSFYLPEKLDTSDKKFLNKEESHHLKNVMRVKIGDFIDITNGAGTFAKARVCEIGKYQLQIEIVEKNEIELKKPEVALAFSLLRNKNDLLIVEKITELGIRQFFPFVSKRSVAQSGINTTDKFVKTAIAAIKQCDNAYLPNINSTETIERSIKLITSRGYELFIALETEKTLLMNDIYSNGYSKICIMIGPEGGFEEKEKDYFNNLGLKTFTLGNHTLRAETAAICAVSQLMSLILVSDRSYY